MNNKPLIIIIAMLTFILVVTSFNFNPSQTQLPVGRFDFDFPMGDGIYDYGPIVWYYGATPEIVEDTHYGIQNPDLSPTETCFGNNVPLKEAYHAGEDWYRFDKVTGELLETGGVEVKAVADGKVVHRNPITRTYPGDVLIIEHTLSSSINGHDKIYSVYMHLDQVFPSENDIVSRGEAIGTVLTQTWNGLNPDPNRPIHDSHLHWEMRYFLDGSNIYDPSTACNKTCLVAGRGYTYPEHPDNFPSGTPYVNPSAFIGHKIYLPFIRKALPSTPTFTPTPTPTVTPTPVTCIEGQDLIVNGGLEDTTLHYLWVQDDGDPGNWPLIDDERPYEGIYGIWLGGRNNANEEIYQAITLPSNIVSATNTFKFHMRTEETGPYDYDIFYWDLKDDQTGESILVNPITYTNQFQPVNTWIPIEIRIPNLGSREGQTLRLSLRDTTDYTLTTSFFIDNVTFNTHCQ